MYKELNISEADGVLAAFNAVCDLKEETERLQAEHAAKEAELAGLRAQTAELFGARLEAEGADEDAVSAAKAMWQHDPANAAMATFGCDFAEAANPYGCNQYGHGFKEPHGAAGGRGQKTFDFFGETVDREREKANTSLEKSMKNFKEAYEERKKAEEEYNKSANWKEASEKWDRAEENLVKQAREARKQRAEIRKRYKNFELDESDDKLIDDILKGYDDDEVKSSRTLEEILDADVLEAANPYGCNQYGHEWSGKHGENWKPSGRGGQEKQGEKGGSNEEKVSPHRRPDGSFNVPSIGKAKAIPTYIPKPKGLSEREQLAEDTKYKPEWIVRKPVKEEADKALSKLREKLKKEKPGSETWTKYKTHENSINGFVSRMLNSTTERQRREQMRFLLQYLEHVDKDLYPEAVK